MTAASGNHHPHLSVVDTPGTGPAGEEEGRSRPLGAFTYTFLSSTPQG